MGRVSDLEISLQRIEKASKNFGKMFSRGLILSFFSTQEGKKFPYLKPTAHSEIVLV